MMSTQPLIKKNNYKKESLSGFTLIELLLSLSILVLLLVIVPHITKHMFLQYEEHLFLRRFEQTMKVAQMSAQVTGRSSVISFSQQERVIMTLRVYGDSSLDEIVELPYTMKPLSWTRIRFEERTGRVTLSGQGAGGKLIFSGENFDYRYTFQLLNGRYYVTTEEKKRNDSS